MTGPAMQRRIGKAIGGSETLAMIRTFADPHAGMTDILGTSQISIKIMKE
jgi:hypothetical protein